MELLGSKLRADSDPVSGQTLVEVALILVFVTLVIVVFVAVIGRDTSEPIGNVANQIEEPAAER